MADSEPEIEQEILAVARQLDAQICGLNLQRHQQEAEALAQTLRAALFVTAPPDLAAHDAGDDIRLVCFADNAPSTFWCFVGEVNNDEDLQVKARKWSPYEAEEFEHYLMTTTSQGSHIYLSFCRHSASKTLYEVSSATFPAVSKFGMTPKIAARHGDVKDALRAQEMIIASQGAYYDCYRPLKTWAKTSRLIATEWPVLSLECLQWMLLNLAADSRTIASFNACYVNADEIMTVKTCTQRPPPLSTSEHAKIIAEAVSELQTAGDVRAFSSDYYFTSFLSTYDHYILIEGECHDIRAQGRYDAAMRDTTNAILTSLERKIQPSMRVWPDRLVEQEYATLPSGNRGRETLVCDVKLPQELVNQVAQRQIAQTMATQQALHQADFTVAINSKLFSSADVRGMDLFPVSAPASKAGPTPKNDQTQSQLAVQTPVRFRSVRQVLARLQHDPAHRSASYEVGYLDRFDGLKWKAIEEFAKPTEDEEFIPEHPVKQVRRTGGQSVVWDRSSKTDRT